jgi:hypothetical protein
MSDPEFSFQSRQLYLEQQRNRVKRSVLRVDEVYTALSLLEATFSNHEAVAFPVRFEPVERSENISLIGTRAVRMVLLDQDFHRILGSPAPCNIEKGGTWEVQRPIGIEKSTKPVSQGYLLFSLPGEPLARHLHDSSKQDPNSIEY